MAILMDPSVASSYASLTLSENALQRYEASFRSIRAAVMLAPRDAKLWALFLDAASQFDDAAAAGIVAEHMPVEPASVETSVTLLRVLRRSGRFAEARGWLSRLFRRHGVASADLWAACAELDSDQERPLQAWRAARRASVLAPADSVWAGLVYSLCAANDRQRLNELTRLTILNAPAIGDVYRAIVRPGGSRMERVRDVIRVGASSVDRAAAQRCLFLAAMTSESDDLPFESPEERQRLATVVEDDLDTSVMEVRAFYIHRHGRFFYPLPRIAEIRQAPGTVPDVHPDGLTVIVPTGNRLTDLKAVIFSYDQAIENGAQFVFSVYADREGTAQFLRARYRSRPGVTVVETPAPHFSKAAAINVAAAHVRRRFVLLLDCDCILIGPDAAATCLNRLHDAPNDVHSVGYRGMIALRHALFVAMGGFPSFLVEAQHALAARPEQGKAETDDMLFICEFLLRYQTRHVYWSLSRFEEIKLSGEAWLAEMRPAEQTYEHVISHYGEYRVVRRSDRYTFLNDRQMYRDQFMLRGRSLRTDPFFTKMRRYIEYEAQARGQSGELEVRVPQDSEAVARQVSSTSVA